MKIDRSLVFSGVGMQGSSTSGVEEGWGGEGVVTLGMYLGGGGGHNGE